jgi:hypothetical protein
MKKLRPLLVSLLIALLAVGAISLLTRKGGDEPAPEPSPSPSRPPQEQPEDGPPVETVALSPRDSLDPTGLWPPQYARLASPDFWVIWQTAEHSAARLLVSGGSGAWIEFGRTVARDHLVQVPLHEFDGRVAFCVEFEERGREWRSAPRLVTFGAGARFEKRRYEFRVTGEPMETFELNLLGRNPSRLGDEPFLTALFPEDVRPFAVAGDGDDEGGVVHFGVADGSAVPPEGCYGFLQVYDPRANTYDRVLVALRR